MEGVTFVANPTLGNEALNALFASAWPGHEERDFQPVLARSLGYVCAMEAGDRLLGFVNLAWDGGSHAFLLDPTVHPDHQRRGIGTELVRRAALLAYDRRVEWLHVDYEPRLTGFYERCGFRPTAAGVLKLDEPASS